MTDYNLNFIEKFPKFVQVSRFFDRMFHSFFYLLFIVLVSVLGFALGQEIVAIFILLFVVSLNLATCRDVSPCFLATMLIALVPMKYANATLDGFITVAYALIFFLPSIALRFYFFPVRLVKGKNLVPLIVYSVVLILGGLGSDITPSEYFAFYPIYTMLGLGFLQVLMYVFWYSYTPTSSESNVRYFAKIMCTLALVCIIMIVAAYVEFFIDNPNTGFQFVIVLWKNYVTDVLMLTMPFAFYLAVKSKHCLPFTAFGLLQYVAIIFTQSGGGMAFATIMMPFLLFLTLVKADRKNRIVLLTVFGILCAGILAFVVWKRDIFIALYEEKIATGGTSRFDIYELAIDIFKRFPIFGCGWGYIDDGALKYLAPPYNFIMMYYHSSFFQALASMGIVGVIGYAVMATSRLATFIKKYTFNLFLLIGFLGYAGYSLVDVGTAMPFPFSAMITFMLVTCEKYNSYRATKETNEKIENLMAE